MTRDQRDPLVRSSRVGGMAVIELHRPERLHAMDTGLLTELIGALEAAGRDASVDALVITGSDGCFSAGADVSENTDHAGAVARMELFCRLYEVITLFPRPSVAAVSGWCIGGGAEVACACDLRVGAPSAVLRFPGAAFGIPAGTARLGLLVGLSHAKDLLMTARTVGAEEAHRMGLLNRLVAEDELLAAALSLAEAMAANQGAVAQKLALHEAAGLPGRVLRENRALRRWQDQANGLMG